MSSGTRVNMASVSAALPTMSKGVEGEGSAGPTMELSERQLELDRLWQYYRCSNYDGRSVDWAGERVLPKREHEVVATQGSIPAGFYDAGQTGDLPIKYRRPSAPYYLARVVVRRFTSLLFSSKHHPRISCDDPETEDWLNGFAEATRMWSKFSRARNYGGAMGTAVVGFKIIEGKPYVEVHDPRWCRVEFADREDLIVSALEKRYQFKEEVMGNDGQPTEVWFWYRRVITDNTDTVWPRVLVEGYDEPIWDNEEHYSVTHNFGFCPIVWIQNTPMDDDIDGDPDCHGIFDTIEEIDALWSQASKGTKSNCDPTTVITSDAEFYNLQKGSGRALQVEKGGSVQYLEMNGTGSKAAIELAEKLEDKALTIARCVLDTNFDGPARTEVEVEKNYSNMIEACDEFREQYGEGGVKRFLEMVLHVARMHSRTWVDRSGPVPTLVRGMIKLPKKRTFDEETGEQIWMERSVGSGEQIELAWPPYSDPSIESVTKAVAAAGQAKQYALVDEESATKFVAPFFQIEDIRGTVARAKAAQQEMADAFAEQALAAGSGGPPTPPVGKGGFG